MNSDQDSKLRHVLGAWQVSLPPAPNFKTVVWERITADEEPAEVSFLSTLREWLFVQLPKPIYATALLAVTAAIGITAANVRARHARDEYRLENARLYLASIDPIAINSVHSSASR